MEKGWFLSKIISSEYFVTLIISVVGILTVAGVIKVDDPNGTGEMIAKIIAGIVTLITSGIYTLGRVDIKRTTIENAKPEILG